MKNLFTKSVSCVIIVSIFLSLFFNLTAFANEDNITK